MATYEHLAVHTYQPTYTGTTRTVSVTVEGIFSPTICTCKRLLKMLKPNTKMRQRKHSFQV
jgi:hypothetical protein